MADKFTPLIVAALTRAAAVPAGTPLIGAKADAGLFPPSAAAKSAAKKALDDGLLVVVRPDPKPGRELCIATDKGLQFLIDQSSPRQVLEDLVRILEAREGEVADLLAAANRMAEGIAGLKSAVAAVLPRVAEGRISMTPMAVTAPQPQPNRDRGGSAYQPLSHGRGVEALTPETRGSIAVAEELSDDLAAAVLAHLTDWASSAASGQDCPLPELYRALTVREHPPTIGSFHDCLRALYAEGRVYLHPWTGPLYALPEPAYALLVGHNVAYYASLKSGQWPTAGDR